MNTQLFNDANFSYSNQHDSLSILIHVWERFPVIPSPNLEFADRNFNVWWSEQHRSLRRINIGLTLTDRNFLGNREQLSVIGQIGYTEKGGLSYEIPYLDKRQKHGIGIAVYGMQNREVAYITDSNKLQFYRSNTHAMLRQYQMSAWYTYRPRYAATHKISFDYQHYWISGAIAALNPEYLGNGRTQEDVLSLSYTYKYNGVDNWEYPLNGRRLVGMLQQKLMLNDNSYQTILYLQGDKYWKLKDKWYANLIFRGKFSFGQQQPYVFRRNLGYDFDYVRGYEYYVIDGSSFALLRADFKRELLNIQFRLPVKYFQVIPVRVYAKAYADAGRAYNAHPNNDYLYNKTMYSAGLGIDIVTLYDIKLRIEYTINRMGESDLYLHKNGE